MTAGGRGRCPHQPQRRGRLDQRGQARQPRGDAAAGGADRRTSRSGGESRLRAATETDRRGAQHIPAKSPRPATRRTRRPRATTSNRPTSRPTAPTRRCRRKSTSSTRSSTAGWRSSTRRNCPKRDQLELKGLYDTMYGATLLFPNDKMPYEVAATTWTNLIGCPTYKGRPRSTRSAPSARRPGASSAASRRKRSPSPGRPRSNPTNRPLGPVGGEEAAGVAAGAELLVRLRGRRRAPRCARAPARLAKPRLNSSRASPGREAAAEVERQAELGGELDAGGRRRSSSASRAGASRRCR